ncbi:MAG: hypothetical protein ABIK28_15255 [Planctomycetota bacterium]
MRFHSLVLLMFFLAPALAAQTEADKKILSVADQIEGQVAKMRGHGFKHSIEKGIYNKDQLKAFILESFDEELPPEKLAGWETALKIFGLMPEEMNMKEMLVDFYVSQIGGFYDPKTKKLFCISSGLSFMQRIVMAHELAHALQDQYLDLERYYKIVEFNDDLLTARSSVVEGEATHIMNLYPERYAQEMIDDLGDIKVMDVGYLFLQQFAALMCAPPYFYDAMTFPYMDGEGFVKEAIRQGGWQRVDDLYKAPPDSTEQIMHPEKFFQERDAPQKIVLPDLESALKGDFKKIHDNSMGEFQVKILLKHTADAIRALRACTGWDGDTYAIYKSTEGDATFMIWALTFDSDNDAEQFREAEAKALTRKYERWGGGKADSKEKRACFESANNRCACVERRGCDVLVLDAVPTDSGIMEILWSAAWKFEKVAFEFEALKPVPYERSGSQQQIVPACIR